ncbi:hypothetical protein SINU_00255 [Sporolactobacillus inulinus CASD]|uniref:Uncharacterized protein n=1 Tax=Sporolactobacillus inulinus CASD TaxID=1069536 RepID=A0A0U1QSX2_9BACL|nr:hypothetical protein SINU_00255 [Sporolactobacillus inulinus CASD]
MFLFHSFIVLRHTFISFLRTKDIAALVLKTVCELERAFSFQINRNDVLPSFPASAKWSK